MTDNEREAPIIDEHTDPAWQAIGDALGNLGYDLNSHEDTAAWVQQYLFRHSAVRAAVVAEEPKWEYGRRSDVTGYTTEGIYSEEQASNGLMDGWSAVRRRKAGPWAPVNQEGADR